MLTTDLLFAPLWLGVNLLLSCSAWRVSTFLFPTDDSLTRLGHSLVLCWACVVFTTIALGTFGSLTPVLLLTGVAGVSIGGLLWLKRQPPISQSAQGKRTVGWPEGILWATIFSFWLGVGVVGGLLRFPDDWDTLMYHLPAVNHWLQVGSLYTPNALLWSLPGNNEIVALWLVAPFSGDFLFGLNNLPATVLLACGTRDFGRSIGLSPLWRNLAALGTTSGYVVLYQSTTAGNDVAVASLFLCCLGYSLRFSEQGRSADLVLAALALGLLAGVKYYALGYVAVAGTATVVLVGRTRGSGGLRKALVVGLGGLSLLGAYWYLRNWVAAGSPFWPLGIGFSQDELSEIYPRVWESTLVGNGRPEVPSLLATAVIRIGGPCHWTALLGFPVAVSWLVISSFQSPRRRYRAGRLLLATATVGAFLVWLVTPYSVEDRPGTLNQLKWMYCPVRYGWSFLSLAVIALAVLVADVTHGLRPNRGRVAEVQARFRVQVLFGAIGTVVRTIFVGLFVAAVGAQFVLPWDRLLFWPTDPLIVGSIALLVIANLVVVVHLAERIRRVTTAGVLLIMCVAFAVAVGVLSARWHGGHAQFYDQLLSRGTFTRLATELPHGSMVCVLDYRPYPFLGSARQFRVCQPSRMGSHAWWWNYLRGWEVRLIAARFDLRHDGRGWLALRNWIHDRPERYQRIGQRDGAYALYRVAMSREE